jgi:hypothetical protein
MRRYPERMLLKNDLMDTICGMSLVWPTEKPITLAPLQKLLPDIEHYDSLDFSNEEV